MRGRYLSPAGSLGEQALEVQCPLGCRQPASAWKPPGRRVPSSTVAPSLRVGGWGDRREAGESRERRPQCFSLPSPRSASDSVAEPHLKPEAEAGLMMQLRT